MELIILFMPQHFSHLANNKWEVRVLCRPCFCAACFLSVFKANEHGGRRGGVHCRGGEEWRTGAEEEEEEEEEEGGQRRG